MKQHLLLPLLTVLASAALASPIAKPVVTIVKPALHTRSNSIAFSGTVSDGAGVASVSYVISNLNNPSYVLSGQATLSTGKGSSNWTFQPGFLSPGTNLLVVQGSNYSGRTSTASRAFFFRDTAPFSLEATVQSFGATVGSALFAVTGRASFAGDPPPTHGANLYIGEGYTVTATHAPNTFFQFWLVNNQIVSYDKTFSFLMENGLNVQAIFGTNQFIGMAGRYDGIFSGSGDTNSGLIGNLRLGTNGVYSGTLYLAGSPYSLHGTFNSNYQATEIVPRPNADGSNVTLVLGLGWSTPRVIFASLQSKGWSGNGILFAAQTNSQSVSYTMLFAPGSGPLGYGYALITNKNGVLTLGGALADGSAFTQSTALGEDGEFPIYANLYNKGGLLLGRIDPSSGGAPAQWIKPPAKSGAYSNGFNVSIGTLGAVWSQAQGTYSNIVANDPHLVISGSGLSNNIDVTLASGTTITHGAGTNLSSFGFNPANGMLSVVFTNNLHMRVNGFGALLQNDSFGAGYYISATNVGIFTLTPRPSP